ncbi:MAG: PQQ-binding-like beta-propeller repeat protein [Chloroflexi bacterium]|nr:PQQ-binding-like beta-propeller repeat protein [Chloroflexota bacterium]
MHLPFNKFLRLQLAFLISLIYLSACSQYEADRALNGDKLHEAWKQDVGAPVNHPPLRVGNVLIVVPNQMPMLALDVKTGKKLWEFDPGVRVWDRAYTSDGGHVFVGIEGGNLIALDPSNGKKLWETDLGINAQVPPLVANGVVYVSTTYAGAGLVGDPNGKAKLFAMDPQDGHILWEFESDNYVLQSPFRYGDSIYLAGSFSDPRPVDEGGHMRLYALDASDGSVRWIYESDDGFAKQVYAAENMVVYIAYQDFAVGVDTASGELRWRQDTGNWVPTLSGSGNMVYYGSANTIVHAINIDTGNLAWQFNIPKGTFNYVLGAPVRAASDLVFFTQLGELFSLNADTGELRWTISTGIVGARTGPSISGGWLFIGDADGFVYGYTDN